jgi:putative FmdB family regulatory protein
MMPRYDFRCYECGNAENDRTARYEEIVVCKNCGGIMNRLPAAPNFKLVGKGFHCNDYPKKRS